MALTHEDKAWLDKRIEAVISSLLDKRSEIARRLDGVDHRMDCMSSTLLSVQSLNKAIMDLGSMVSQLSRGQMQSTSYNLDLETRIARLEVQVSKLLKPAA